MTTVGEVFALPLAEGHIWPETWQDRLLLTDLAGGVKKFGHMDLWVWFVVGDASRVPTRRVSTPEAEFQGRLTSDPSSSQCRESGGGNETMICSYSWQGLGREIIS